MPHIFLIFCLIWIQAAAQVGQPPELHIKTSSGIINGKYNNTAQTVRGFIGVPYAEPPVGRLRWEPPRPKSPPSHPIDAFSFSNPCAQVYTYSNESIWSILPYKIWNAANMSEDCLYMNIWAPSTKHHSKKRKAAVMMFIHGGSYASGSGSVSYYDGTNLVQDDEDIIAVTFKSAGVHSNDLASQD
jgi:carboxylesterase type B